MSQEQSASEQNSTGSIDPNQAGELLSGLFSPEPRDQEPPAGHEEPKKEEKAEDKPLTEEEALERAAAEEANPDPAAQAKDTEPVKVTVNIDGKPVELTPEEIAEAYKSGMRQADYTRKTTEAAEQRKAAEAKAAQAEAMLTRAQQERTVYAQNLNLMGQQLQGVLQNQAQVDMDRLSVDNPAEYVKQLHLQNQRQAALHQIQQEQFRVAQQVQAEQARAAQEAERAQAKARDEYTKAQQDQLLAKLPDWKDSAKAQADQTRIASFLEKELGYSKEEINAVNDHRAVLMAHDAMRYRELMAKAKASTAKVDKLPAKVERPGTATATDPTDGRTAAQQRLARSGSVDDAAAIFSTMFK